MSLKQLLAIIGAATITAVIVAVLLKLAGLGHDARTLITGAVATVAGLLAAQKMKAAENRSAGEQGAASASSGAAEEGRNDGPAASGQDEGADEPAAGDQSD